MKQKTHKQTELEFEQEMIAELKQIDSFENWTDDELKEYHHVLISYSEIVCENTTLLKSEKQKMKLTIGNKQLRQAA